MRRMSAAEYRRTVQDKMHETDEFTPLVIRVAQSLGWLVEHSRPCRTAEGWRTAISGDAGGPDLRMVHAGLGKVLWVELKSDRGRLSDGQKRWAEALAGVDGDGFAYRLWRPADLTDGTIEKELRGQE